MFKNKTLSTGWSAVARQRPENQRIIASINECIFSAEALYFSHDLHIPLLVYRTQNGVKLADVLTEGARVLESAPGFRYAASTGGGLTLMIPGGEGGYHLEIGAAPSVTNALNHDSFAPLATGTFGFDW